MPANPKKTAALLLEAADRDSPLQHHVYFFLLQIRALNGLQKYGDFSFQTFNTF